MTNPFETLGLPAAFTLDQDDLHARYVRASAATHPDRYTDALEQADAAQRAAVLNEAYQTLRDPESRAEALLRVLGGPARGDDKSLPPDLLLEMLEVREEMERAVEKDDRATLERLRDWARQERAARLTLIGELFARAADPAADERHRTQTLRHLRLQLNALRYFQRMLEQMPA